jgi:hypothetical protein
VRTFAQHKDTFARNKELPGWDRISGSETVLEFDDRHTRRVYGYDSVEHYYSDASSSRHIPAARIPLLSLVAKDDFLIAECQAQYPPKVGARQPIAALKPQTLRRPMAKKNLLGQYAEMMTIDVIKHSLNGRARCLATSKECTMASFKESNDTLQHNLTHTRNPITAYTGQVVHDSRHE